MDNNEPVSILSSDSVATTIKYVVAISNKVTAFFSHIHITANLFYKWFRV